MSVEARLEAAAPSSSTAFEDEVETRSKQAKAEAMACSLYVNDSATMKMATDAAVQLLPSQW